MRAWFHQREPPRRWRDSQKWSVADRKNTLFLIESVKILRNGCITGASTTSRDVLQHDGFWLSRQRVRRRPDLISPCCGGLAPTKGDRDYRRLRAAELIDIGVRESAPPAHIAS
jgi:hypothetical protein